MSVSIYRNILNGEMKRFGKFGKRIVDNLSVKGISINLVYNPQKQICINEMNKSDTLIFISHGSANAIFHRYCFGKKLDQILFDVNNISQLKGKKVIAISCGTARILGDVACQSTNGCKVYLGFLNRIHFSKKNKKPSSAKYHNFIISCYKDTFEQTIQDAIEYNWSFQKLKLVLEMELKRNIALRTQEFKDRNYSQYNNLGIGQSIFAVMNVANNIVLFGDGQQKVG